MYEAKGQAELYVRNLPASEHNPPFIIVADVGHSIELFSDFSRQGRTYIPFPDPATHRLKLRDLAEAEIRERLRQVWTEPLALDPSAARRRSRARSPPSSPSWPGHSSVRLRPDLVAHFLMRCLFTFFAEDVGLLPKDCFTAMLGEAAGGGPDHRVSRHGRLSLGHDEDGRFLAHPPAARAPFQRRPFRAVHALPLTDEQIDLLIDSGREAMA